MAGYRGRPIVALSLGEDERSCLEQQVRRHRAAETDFSHTTIRRIWNGFGLQLHRKERFKLSTDPLFVDKVRDIVGLYPARPPGLWCSVWMRRARYRHLTAHNRFFP